MSDEKKVNPGKDAETQKKRKAEHMLDPEKNEKAFGEQVLDTEGRDWTKPRTFLKDGEV
ncbi:MAG: hypothetical protein FWG23_00205 [Eggerthellaceae bacterium]|nr:hypothetical protein [Eggerthellaceae bacterium]MDR2715263.1 hypothetical protein [Coriobacteriaceae bacterium]